MLRLLPQRTTARLCGIAPCHKTITKSLRFSGGWSGARGHDITGESLTWGDRPKVIVTAFSATGIDVQNTVKKIGKDEKSDGSVHMNGSIMAFPFGCFFWNVKSIRNVTAESLEPVLLLRPKLEYLFIGCSGTERLPLEELVKIQTALKPIVVEQMAMSNAIGTFNILNAEDRQVAAALVLDPKAMEDE